MPVKPPQTIISVKGLNFSYGDNHVIKDVNLDIHSGDYVGIIGPNGGGKTTLVKLILGLLHPDSGRIGVFGVDIDRFSDWFRVGFVAQRVTNFDPLFPITVWEVVSQGLVSKKGLFLDYNDEDKNKIRFALESVQMLNHKDKLIGNLSGGQQQRVFIARALVSSPEIIFLDEPTSGVDIPSQEDFYKLLRYLNSELGITLVLISHDVDAITGEVNELLCINQKLVYHGSPKEFEGSSHMDNLYSKGVKLVLHRH